MTRVPYRNPCTPDRAWRAAVSLLALLILARPVLPHGEPGPGEQDGGGALPYPLSFTRCENGYAAVYPCSKADLWAYLPLSAVGGSATANDLWGWTDPQSGREFVLLGLSDGTAFVEVTDPSAPVYLGKLPTASGASLWRDIKVYRHYALVVSEAPFHGLQVFDLRRLLTVRWPTTFTADAWYTRFSNAHNLVVNEDTGFAFAVGSNTCGGGLHRIDLSDPLTPRFAGCFSEDGYTHDAQCVVYHGSDGRFVGREICFCANEDTLTIVDWTGSDPPTLLSRTDYPNRGYTHQGWLTPDHAFFLVDDEFDERLLPANTRTLIWDVRDLRSPSLRGVFTHSTSAIDHNQYVHEWDGRWLVFQANYRAGLRVLELLDPESAQLRELAFFDLYPADDLPAFHGAWSVYPFFPSRTIAVSGIEQGLFLLRLNLSPETHPTPLPSPHPPIASMTPAPTATRAATLARARLGGVIRSIASSQPIAGVEVQLDGAEIQMTTTSDATGAFSFLAPPGTSVRIQPRARGNVGHAISTADAVWILRWIVGLQSLSPAQRLAADTNGDGRLSVADAVAILRLLVGLEPTLAAARACDSDWLFFPLETEHGATVPPSVGAQGCSLGHFSLVLPDSDLSDLSFAALPIGDVNASWQPPAGTCEARRCPPLPGNPKARVRSNWRDRRGTTRVTLAAAQAGTLTDFFVEIPVQTDGARTVHVRLAPRWRGALAAAHIGEDGVLRVALASSEERWVEPREVIGTVTLRRIPSARLRHSPPASGMVLR